MGENSSPLIPSEITLPNTTSPVIAVRANDISFTGLLRGIAAGGGTPISVVYDWPGAGPWHSEHSCHYQSPIHIANPFTDEQQSLEDLITLGKCITNQYKERVLVLPSSDTIQSLFLNYEHELLPYYKLMGSPKYESFRAEMTDKGSFFECLQKRHPELCPKTIVCRTESDIKNTLLNAPLPAVIKPAQKDYGQSFYQKNKGAKITIATNKQELIEQLNQFLPTGPLLIQEKIDFYSIHDEIPFYAMIDSNGSIRVAATGVKRCIQPPKYGTATILELSWHAELLPLSEKLANAIEWSGTLMIEWIKDKKDDQWKVIEINTRPWLFHDFYRQNGLPFVPFAVQDALKTLPTSEKNDKPITPHTLPDLNGTPYHIDLLPLCLQPTDEPTVQALQKQLAINPEAALQTFTRCLQQEGAILSYTYSDTNDPQPYYHRWRQIQDTCKLNNSMLT